MHLQFGKLHTAVQKGYNLKLATLLLIHDSERRGLRHRKVILESHKRIEISFN